VTYSYVDTRVSKANASYITREKRSSLFYSNVRTTSGMKMMAVCFFVTTQIQNVEGNDLHSYHSKHRRYHLITCRK
jgi:hypothetical protein